MKIFEDYAPPSLCSLMCPALHGILGGSRYEADGVVFDGVNDYLQSTSALSTAADSQEFIFSAWLRFNSTAGDGVSQRVLHSTVGTFQVNRSSANNISLGVTSSTGGTVWGNAISTGTYTSTSGWIHVLATMDAANSSAQLLVNGLSDLIAASTVLNRTADFTLGHWSVGANVDASEKAYADMFDVYLNISTDLGGAAAALSKFRDGSGKPVDLGSSGELPTGTAPIMFLHVDNGSSANDFATNFGSGSSFTVVGTLAISTSSPTD